MIFLLVIGVAQRPFGECCEDVRVRGSSKLVTFQHQDSTIAKWISLPNSMTAAAVFVAVQFRRTQGLAGTIHGALHGWPGLHVHRCGAV